MAEVKHEARVENLPDATISRQKCPAPQLLLVLSKRIPTNFLCTVGANIKEAAVRPIEPAR